MTSIKLPSQDTLNQLFIYKDGNLYWKIKKSFNVERGSLAGCLDQGYFRIGINKKIYKRSRLVWKMINGVDPLYEIDHIDQNKQNDRIENLRDIKQSKQQLNRPIQSNNVSGCVGVYFYKKYNKWLARISVNKKRLHLGYFDNKEDAVKARKKAEIEYGYHKNHGKSPVT